MKDPHFLKLLLFINALVPLGLLASDAWNHQLGANPVESALHTTGKMALIFLLLTLAITPARKLTGWNWLSHFRRMLGLFAFFYGCTHFLIYLIFNQAFDLPAVVRDVIKRPFILYGMTCLLLMIPLAITSTNGMIKRLGAAKWKLLHALIYPAALAGVLHYWPIPKADKSQPKMFAAALTVLLGYRLLARARRLNKQPTQLSPP
jgi:methionine sulfoxide reductase heme-binding subunit